MRTRLGRRAVVPVLALALALAPALAPVLVTSATADATSAVTGAKVTAGGYAAAAVKATNNRREAHDLERLRTGTCLEGFAARQARRMAAQERMFHQDLGPVVAECGLDAAGENVAYGYPSGRAVVKAWMHSDGHRANILNPDYRRLGIAARKGDDGSWYVSQVFGRKA